MVSLYDIDVGDDEIAAVEDVIESGQLAAGPVVSTFESEFAEYVNADEAVAVANGTAALHAALRGVGVEEGDAVVAPPLSFVATANAIRFCGAEPVFADINDRTYTIDPDEVAAILADRDDVAAVVAVHLYGIPANMDRLRSICTDAGVALIEDAAQAHGARYDGEPVGSLGDVACFSFYPTKNMTTGEGGMVTTDDAAVADRVSRFINHGRDSDGRHVEVGYNYRMSSISAAIGREQLSKLPSYVEARRTNAEVLTKALAATPLQTPAEPGGRFHAYHQYVVRTPDRHSFRSYLDEHDIDTGVYYANCIHQEPAYVGFDPAVPVAERVSDSVVSLPIHPNLETAELKYVADTITEYDW